MVVANGVIAVYKPVYNQWLYVNKYGGNRIGEKAWENTEKKSVDSVK